MFSLILIKVIRIINKYLNKLITILFAGVLHPGIYIIIIYILHEVGFEPTHLTIAGLKSAALDHSAIRAVNTSFMFLIYLIKICCMKLIVMIYSTTTY